LNTCISTNTPWWAGTT